MAFTDHLGIRVRQEFTGLWATSVQHQIGPPGGADVFRPPVENETRHAPEARRQGGAADWRVIFMGTPEFSVPVLDALIAAGHEIAAVLHPAAPPRGPRQEGPAEPRPGARRGAWPECPPSENPARYQRTRRVRRAERRCRRRRGLRADPAAGPCWMRLRAAASTSTRASCRAGAARAPIQRAIMAGDAENRRLHHADGGGARHRAGAAPPRDSHRGRGHRGASCTTACRRWGPGRSPRRWQISTA